MLKKRLALDTAGFPPLKPINEQAFDHPGWVGKPQTVRCVD
jgi:hypothetical protein